MVTENDLIKQALKGHIKQQDLDTADQKLHNVAMSSEIKDIKENHLVHLKEDIYKLKSKVNGLYLVAGVLGPLVIWLMNKYL